MYNSRVQAASAVGSTTERGGHEIRSKKTSAAAVLQDLLYKRGVKPKGDIWRKAFTVLQDLLYRGGDQTKRWYLPHNQVPSTQVLEDLLYRGGDINQKVIFLPLQKFQVMLGTNKLVKAWTLAAEICVVRNPNLKLTSEPDQDWPIILSLGQHHLAWNHLQETLLSF